MKHDREREWLKIQDGRKKMFKRGNKIAGALECTVLLDICKLYGNTGMDGSMRAVS